MPSASYVQDNFLGGEWSPTAQGHHTDPKYKIAMGTCFNGFPLEPGAWTRRPGTRELGFTRLGAPGRVIAFPFEEDTPYNMEFTDLTLRFWDGPILATTNDSVAITAISTANPAVVTLASAVTWATGNSAYFTGLGTNDALLQNRRVVLTRLTSTTFSIQDEIPPQATIDGSTLGTFVSGTLNRVQEVTTPYIGGVWSSLRSVQAEDEAVLLQATQAPQILTVVPPTGAQANATFTLAPASFLDGPYLDPFTNGVMAVPSGTTGLVNLTLSFPAYVATTAYAIGAVVTSSSINYTSLINQNLGNTPASNPSDWQAINASVAVNYGNGFLLTDVGRLVRLFSEPPLWVQGTYTAGQVVTYNPTGLPGAGTYWQAQGTVTAVPGADLTNWKLVAIGAALPSITQIQSGIVPLNVGANSGPAQWTWGVITALLQAISGTISGVVHIGDLTGGGGLAGAFDGNTGQLAANSATLGTTFNPNAVGNYTFNRFLGQNYSACSPTAFAVDHVTVFPSTDQGLVDYVTGTFSTTGTLSLNLVLYGKNTAPAAYNDGTILGTAYQQVAGVFPPHSNSVMGTTPVTIISNDLTTTYHYVWVAMEVNLNVASFTGAGNANMQLTAGQLQISSPATTASTSAGVTIALLGPPLLYTNPIVTWQLGAYSNTTGWPTCGTYEDGRIWLSGAVKNRVDACYANGLDGDTINFAPTDQYGTVSAANAINRTFTAPDANPIFWMEPDQQGIICGTQAGEWLISAPTAGGLSPLNIADRRVTTIRCANIEPRRTEHTHVLVQTHQRKTVEYFPDVFSGKFTAPDLAEKWKHLTVSGIQELGYQQELVPIVWHRMGDGSLVGLTYRRDTLMTSQGPTVSGAHRHSLGSGRLVSSIAVGPSELGNLDALSMTTQDTSTGLYHVEMMTDLFEDGDTITEAWHLDGAITPSSYVVSGTTVTINGLLSMNGKVATAWIAGVDAGDFAVTNGTMTVPLFGQTGQANPLLTAAYLSTFGASIPMVVGFTYTSSGQCLTPQEAPQTGARQGPAFGKRKRFHGLQAQLVNTQGISLATSLSTSSLVANRLRAAQLKTPGGGSLLAQNVLFSGVWKDTLSDDPQGFANAISWSITRPYPATVAAVGGFLETADE